MKVEVASEIDEFERERYVFTFDPGYLALRLQGYFHEIRGSDCDPWEVKGTCRPPDIPEWVVISARTNLAQRIDVLT